MNLFNRAKLALKILNRYEAVQPSFSRRYIYSTTQGARYDITPFTRIELSRKARYWEKNSAIINRILDISEMYTVGNGLTPTPQTSDEKFNQEASDYFAEWMNYCDLSSPFHFFTYQANVNRGLDVDGDIFTLLTSGETGYPRIQLIEGHRCGTPFDTGQKNENVFDGVEVDARGRPIAYHLAEEGSFFSGKDQKTQRVEAQWVVPHFIPTRAGQLRGISSFHAVMNTLQDLEDTLALEKDAVKRHSSVRDVIENDAGEVESGEDLIRKGTYTDNDGQQRDAYYKQSIGAETVVLKKGDKYNLVASQRPSPAWTGFVEHLMEQICLGYGVSYATVWNPKSQGGATLRLVLEQDQRFFHNRAFHAKRQFQRIYEYVIEYAIKAKQIKAPAPKDWKKAHWSNAKKVTVDLGHESQSRINEFRGGMGTLQDIYDQEGADWKKKLLQKAKEIDYANQLAKTYGLERAEIIALDPNEIAKLAQTGQDAQRTEQTLSDPLTSGAGKTP